MPVTSPKMSKQKRPVSKLLFLFVIALLLLSPGRAYAQNYSFSVPVEQVDVYWNKDGTESIDYAIQFANDPNASPIDFVDIATPSPDYDIRSITADVDGQPITDISKSPYVTWGVALGLGSNAIQPGETGTVHVFIGTVRNVLYPDTQDSSYASAVFSPTQFDASLLHGSTDMTVTFHLPAGVQPDEPRWHAAPSGFSAEPKAGIDEQGRVAYSWQNTNANASKQYMFGASFPAHYVPSGSIVTKPFQEPGPAGTVSTGSQFPWGALAPLACIAFFGIIIGVGLVSDRKRKLQYLPPKVSIEGHGIKRGLTAVEAGILMEQPMDKILTMILFSLVKKNAARVVKRDPLEIEKIEPTPEDMRPYESDFLNAFVDHKGPERRKALQKMMVDLVKSVGNKMKGFSRRETIAYYQDIMKRAWAQVEAADTPEVKSETYDKVMEWTMLDKNYEGHTQEVFRGGPVFVPIWWPRYDPKFGRTISGPATTAPVSTSVPTGSPSGPALPHLPGSDFAASIVTGVQSFAGGVIGNLNDFTSGITRVTNPPPKPTSTGGGRSHGIGGGGCACACACACAGCACACAGGGR